MAGPEQLILTLFLCGVDYYCGAGKPADRMARKLRVRYPGAIYHVMNRGAHRGVGGPASETGGEFI